MRNIVLKVTAILALVFTLNIIPTQSFAIANVPMCKSNPLNYSWVTTNSFAPNTFCIYSDASNTQIKFLNDGNLVWQKQNGTTIWASNTSGIGKSLTFSQNGNIQVKNAAGLVVWNANKAFGVDHTDRPTSACHNELKIDHLGSDIFINKVFSCSRSGHLDWEVHL